MRAIFFDEDDAATVVRRLQADGYEASAERERFQGEDDDEDHPWAVLSDAPEFVLDVLVDQYDGWLDHEAEPATVVPKLPPLRLHPTPTPTEPSVVTEEEPEASTPIELPTAPRRVKRPDLLSARGLRERVRRRGASD